MPDSSSFLLVALGYTDSTAARRAFLPTNLPFSMACHDASLIRALQRYTACDLSDALLKLKVPGAGFIPDLKFYGCTGEVTIAPASTVLFAPKGMSEAAPASGYEYPPANIPDRYHWADITQPGTIVVIRQPDGLKNAVCGGIMALRMRQCEAKGIVVWGRARDVTELKGIKLPVSDIVETFKMNIPQLMAILQIWATGTSTVGAGASCTPWAVQVPIAVDGGTVVQPGDIVFSDPNNGVIVIPKDKLSCVVELLPRLTDADEKVKKDVLKGMTVQQAFKLHRSQ